jgi:hypothetical protein
MSIKKSKILLAGVMFAITGGAFAATDADTQAQLDALKAAIPKFAVPMREVGDRFQNMYFAAKGGNWALAAYMSKYMNGAMNPAKLTKPDEYKMWKGFYEGAFASVDKAIQAKDLKGFEKAHAAVIENCNGCHAGMGYGFIKIAKLKVPADPGIIYTGKSEPGDVPK